MNKINKKKLKNEEESWKQDHRLKRVRQRLMTLSDALGHRRITRKVEDRGNRWSQESRGEGRNENAAQL